MNSRTAPPAANAGPLPGPSPEPRRTRPPRRGAPGAVPPAPAAPRGCTNLKLRQLGRLVARHYEAHVGPTGLKATQYSLLSFVVKLGPLRSGALAAAIKLDASTLSRNLQPLIDKRLVEVGVAEDQRSRIVAATLAGEALREEARHAWKRAQGALNQRLGEARVAALHALLEESMALLEAPEGEDDE